MDNSPYDYLDQSSYSCRYWLTSAFFSPDYLEREAARRFYEAFGFTAGELADPGPEGGSLQIFCLSIED